MIGSNIYTAAGLSGVCGLMLLGLFAPYPAVRAYEKERHFVKWYIFSFLLFPFALATSLVIRSKSVSKE